MFDNINTGNQQQQNNQGNNSLFGNNNTGTNQQNAQQQNQQNNQQNQQQNNQQNQKQNNQQNQQNNQQNQQNNQQNNQLFSNDNKQPQNQQNNTVNNQQPNQQNQTGGQQQQIQQQRQEKVPAKKLFEMETISAKTFVQSTSQKYKEFGVLSNSFLFDLIVQRDQYNFEDSVDFEGFLRQQIIWEKLVKGIGYYLPNIQETETFKQSFQKLKWLGTMPLSQKSKDFILRISTLLDLDPSKAFTFIDLYFRSNEKSPLAILQIPEPQKLSKQQETHLDNFRREIIQKFHLEKIRLLQCQIHLITEATGEPDLEDQFLVSIRKVVTDLIEKENLAGNCWESYNRLFKQNVPVDMKSQQEISLWEENLLRQELLILKQLFLIYSMFQEVPSQLFLSYLELFHKQLYIGSLSRFQKKLYVGSNHLIKEGIAEEISHTCILTLLSMLKINHTYYNITTKEIRLSTQNPWALIKSHGEKITHFFREAETLTVEMPVIQVWASLISQSNNPEQQQVSSKIDVMPLFHMIQESDIDHISAMTKLIHQNAFQSLQAIGAREVVYNWVNLQLFDPNFNSLRLTEIACECLRDKDILHSFWNTEYPEQKQLAVLLFRLLEYFPFRENHLYDFLYVLIGDEQQYADQVIGVLDSLQTYTIEEDGSLPLENESNNNYRIKSIYELDQIYWCEEGARLQLIQDPDGRQLFKFEYPNNYWNIIFQKWNEMILALYERDNNNFEMKFPVNSYIKLICNLIIKSPTCIEYLGERMIFSQQENPVKISVETVITTLLMDTLSVFQLFGTQDHFESFSLIIQALKALYDVPESREIVRKIIQIHQSTTANDKNAIFSLFSYCQKCQTSEKNQATSLLKNIMELIHSFIAHEIFLDDAFPSLEYLSHYHGISQSQCVLQQATQMILETRIQSYQNKKMIIQLSQMLEDTKSFIYSNFLMDALDFMFKNILPQFKNIGTDSQHIEDKYQLGTLLCKTTELLLQKFLLNQTRLSLKIFTSKEVNPMLMMLAQYFNQTNLLKFLFQIILRVAVRVQHKSSGQYLGIQNALLIESLAAETTPEQRIYLRQLISSALSLIDTILDLAIISLEAQGQNQPCQSLQYIVDMDMIKKIKILFTDINQGYIQDEVNCQVKINYILAIASYIDYEQQQETDTISDSYDIEKQNTPLLQRNMKTKIDFLFQQNEAERSLLLDTVNGNLLINPFYRNKTRTIKQTTSLTALSLRCLSKILVFWQQGQSTQKLQLSDYMSIKSPNGNYFESKSSIHKKVIIQVLQVIEASTEESIAAYEFLITCLYSQLQFIDMIFRQSSEQQESRIIHSLDIIITEISNQKEIWLTSYSTEIVLRIIIFLQEVIRREDRFKQFVRLLREGKTQLLAKTLELIFDMNEQTQNLLPLVEDLRIEQDLTPEESQIVQVKLQSVLGIKIAQNSSLKIALDLMTNELFGQRHHKQLPFIENILKYFFTGHFTMLLDHFSIQNYSNITDINSLKSFNSMLQEMNNMDQALEIQLFPTILQHQLTQNEVCTTEEEVEQYRKKYLIINDVYDFLDINYDGYGRNYLIDVQETFTQLQYLGYGQGIAFDFLSFAYAYNNSMTLQKIQIDCMTGFSRLFRFVCSIGFNGIAQSTSLSTANYIQKGQKYETHLLNKKADVDYKIGFLRIFSDQMQEGLQRKETIEFLKLLVKSLWNSINFDNYQSQESLQMLQDIETKLEILQTAIFLLTFMLQANHSPQDSLSIEEMTLKPQFFNLGIGTQIFQQLPELLDLPFQLQSPQTVDTKVYVFFAETFLNYYSVTNCLNQDQQIDIQEQFSIFQILIERQPKSKNLIIILKCLGVLFHMNRQQMMACYQETQLTKILMRLLGQKNIYIQKYIAIVKFFLLFCEHEITALHLQKHNLIPELCRLAILHSGTYNRYVNEERTIIHGFWCWALTLVRNYMGALTNQTKSLKQVLQFLHTYHRFIILTLTYEGTERKGESGITIQKQHLSTAYLEELECTMLLLQEVFVHANKWSKINSQQFEQILHIMLNQTVQLFKANFSLSQNFKPMTKYERILNKISAESIKKNNKNENHHHYFQRNQSFQPSQIYTSKATPISKIRGFGFPSKPKQENYRSITSKDESDLLIQAYTPTMYMLKIEVHLHNILFPLMFSLQNGLENTNLLNYFDERFNFNVSQQAQGQKSQFYSEAYWQKFGQSIVDCQQFLIHSILKWSSRSSLQQKSLQKYKRLMSSVQASIHYNSMNNLFALTELDTLREQSYMSFEYTLNLMKLHLQMFNEQMSYNQYQTSMMRKLQEKVCLSIESAIKIFHPLKNQRKFSEKQDELNISDILKYWHNIFLQGQQQ